MKYLVIDGCLNGTGIMDKYNGGFLNPTDLGLDPEITAQIEIWVSRYESEHFNGFINKDVIAGLDGEGREIARKIKERLDDVKMEYFSEGEMKRDIIE